jgi:hypothetical protein
MSPSDKCWAVWTLGEVILAEGEPDYDTKGYLLFRKRDGTVTAVFSTWNAYRLQNKE